MIQERDQWRALVNMSENLLVPEIVQTILQLVTSQEVLNSMDVLG
jgi:hypothetical protein